MNTKTINGKIRRKEESGAALVTVLIISLILLTASVAMLSSIG